MKQYVILGALILFLASFNFLILLAQVIIRLSTVNHSSRNISYEQSLALVGPKKASIGDRVDVEILYYPQLYKKYVIQEIFFSDSSNAYDIMTRINLERISNGESENLELGFTPFISTVSYTIPSKVCPLKIVYTTCPLVPTKKGKGTIKLVYYPQWRLETGEGYQGDGETITVPIEIK